MWQTAGWTYVRFHGGRASPRSCYGEQALDTWASRLRDTFGRDPDAVVFFNNDHNGCALRDAAWLGRRLDRDGVRVGRLSDLTDDVLRLPPGA